jgi:hypothetical protein
MLSLAYILGIASTPQWQPHQQIAVQRHLRIDTPETMRFGVG